ncbi:MAG: ankyrin repeat domain-containing protein [Coxiellaceae bacterium]|nr:ankyrin repeat domain-containing protein [Coxiellaceae bacterium]
MRTQDPSIDGDRLEQKAGAHIVSVGIFQPESPLSSRRRPVPYNKKLHPTVSDRRHKRMCEAIDHDDLEAFMNEHPTFNELHTPPSKYTKLLLCDYIFELCDQRWLDRIYQEIIASTLQYLNINTDKAPKEMIDLLPARLHTSVFHFLVQYNQLDIIKKITDLISHQGRYSLPNAVDLLNQRFTTPLHLAAKLGRLDMVKLLLKCGANVNGNRLDTSTGTPLSDAILHGKTPSHADITYALLQAGADINILSSGQSSVTSGKTLEERPPYFVDSPLLTIAAQLNLAVHVKILLDNGARINELGENSNTAIYAAVKSRSHEAAMVLLEAGADVKLSNSFTLRTPLHVAAANGDLKMVTALLNAGADPDAADRNQLKAVDYAREKNYSQVVTYIQDRSIKDSAEAGVITGFHHTSAP